MRLLYNGVAEDADGKHTWLAIDSTESIIEATELFDDAGARRWRPKLANVLRHPEDDRSLIRGVMDRLDAIQANQV